MTDKKATILKVNGGLWLPLTIVFVALKLSGQVDWSWLWVMSPLWLPMAAMFGFVAVILAIAALGLVVALLATVAAAVIEAKR